MVVRGGYGLSYFPGNYMSQSLMKNPPFIGSFGPVTSNGASGGLPNLRLSDGLPLPTPTDAANPAGTIIGVAPGLQEHARPPVQRGRREGLLGQRHLGRLRRLARRQRRVRGPEPQPGARRARAPSSRGGASTRSCRT